MDNIVYIVSTEYQLILTIGIIKQYHSMNCNNVVVRVSPIGGKRLNNLNFTGTCWDYREIVYDYNNPPKTLKDDLQQIICLKPRKLYFFLENKFWLNYLFSKLHKNKTTIILAPDGMKVYNNHHYYTTKQRAWLLLKGIKCSLHTKLFPPFPLVEKTYATSKYIDEVWVEHPQYYNNITNKRVVEFHYAIDGHFVNILMNVFVAKDDDFLTIKEGATILFLDSGYDTEDYYNRTISILNELIGKFPNRKLLVKYHPLSISKAQKAFSSIKNKAEVNSSYPAELYLAAAKDAIVISMVSTSELFFNPNCKYFWIYKLYSDMYSYDAMKNPTDYIHVVKDINQIREDL